MKEFYTDYLVEIFKNELKNIAKPVKSIELNSNSLNSIDDKHKDKILFFLPLKNQIKEDQKLGKAVLEKILELPQDSIRIQRTAPFKSYSKQASIDNWKVNATIQIGGQKLACKPCSWITLKLSKGIPIIEFLPTGKKRILLTKLLIPTFLVDDALYKVRMELIDSDKLFKVASTIQNGRVGISTII